MQNAGFLKAVRQSLLECAQQDLLEDAAFQGRPTANYRPFSWQHFIAPIVGLVREGMERFVTSRYDPDFQDLARAAQTAAATKIPQLHDAKDEVSRCILMSMLLSDAHLLS